MVSWVGHQSQGWGWQGAGSRHCSSWPASKPVIKHCHKTSLPTISVSPIGTQPKQGHANRDEQVVERNRWLDDQVLGPLAVGFPPPRILCWPLSTRKPGESSRYGTTAGQEELAFPEHLRSQLLPGLAQGILPHRERGIAP